MITWPDETKMKREGREGLQRFRETSLAAELEASRVMWRVVSWPWTAEPPMRIGLESDAHQALAVTLGEDGIWMLSEDPHAHSLHMRSPEALAREASGLI